MGTTKTIEELRAEYHAASNACRALGAKKDGTAEADRLDAICDAARTALRTATTAAKAEQ